MDPKQIQWLMELYTKERGGLPRSQQELLTWWEDAQRRNGRGDRLSQLYGDNNWGGGLANDQWAPPTSPSDEFVGPPDKWVPVGEGGSGGRMSVLSGAPMGNAAALDILKGSAFNRPNNVHGGDSFGNPAGGSGGPEDMVRAAIMQHLRYLLQPDVSAAPMSGNDLQGMGATSEYPDLKYDTPLSNDRVAAAIGPLMEMYAGVGKDRQAEQAREQELSSAKAREEYTRAQAKALEMNPGKIKPGAAMDAAKALDRTNRWLMAFEQRLKQASGGLVIDPALGEKSSEEATQIAQQIKQNVQQAQEYVQRAIELENQGNVADSAYYAQQAVALLSKYDKLTQEGGPVAPAGGDRVGRAIAGL